MNFKSNLVVLACIVVASATEVALLFVPNGPVCDTAHYLQVCDATKKKGLTPCEQCGEPAVPITYEHWGGFEGPGKVTLTRWCAKHAPSGYGTGSAPTSKDTQIFAFFGFVALILAMQFCGVVTVLRKKVPVDPNMKKTMMFTFLVLPPAAYVLFSFIFFWGDHV